MAPIIGEIAVIVEEGRWLAVGDPESVKTHVAMAMLNQQGGINETVTPGYYTYTVRPKFPLKAVVTLTKVCDI